MKQRNTDGLEVVAAHLRRRSGGLVWAAWIYVAVGDERFDAVAGGGKSAGKADGFGLKGDGRPNPKKRSRRFSG